MVIAALLVIAVLFLLAMTQPRFGTPMANWALSQWGPEGSSVGQAHTKFPAITTVIADEVSLPDRLQVAELEMRTNPLGFLPFISWVSRLKASDGYVRFANDSEDSGKDDKSLNDYSRIVDEINVADIEVRIEDTDGRRTIYVRDGAGSLRSGTLSVYATGANSTLEFEGGTKQAASHIDGRLKMTGENFADLAGLAGLAAPDTPPFDIVMMVDVGEKSWAFEILPETRIGDSDLSGKVDVDPARDTPFIRADLTSQTLDADDLGIVFGIPIGVGEAETSGPAQEKARAAYERSDRLIPNGVIDFSRLDAVDGTIKYTAKSVTDSVFDVRGLKMDFDIDGRVVRAPLLQMSFVEGVLTAYATLDGSQSPAFTTAQGTLDGVPFDNLSLSPYLRGTADGKFNISAPGNGFQQAAAGLEGNVALWSRDADILALAAEGAALDIGEAITLLGESADNRTYANARCAAVAIDFTGGIGTLDPAVVDTDDSVVVLRGDINLGDETLKLSLRSDAKDASLGTLVGDVSIGGTLRHPQIQPISASTLAQFGIAAVLGSLSGGLAALPFIEPGMASDAPCGALLAEAEASAQAPQ